MVQHICTYILISFLAFSGESVVIKRNQYTELCQNAVQLYVQGIDLLIPRDIVVQLDKDLDAVGHSAKTTIVAFAKSFREVLTSSLPDKLFIAILNLANVTYHQLPHKKGEGLIKSFTELFNDIASWFFLMFTSFRSVESKGFHIMRSSAIETLSHPKEYAERVCHAIEPPVDLNLTNPASLLLAGDHIVHQLIQFLNTSNTANTVTQYDNIITESTDNSDSNTTELLPENTV